MQRYISQLSSFIYKKGVKPVLFKFDPEQVHITIVKIGVNLTRWSLIKTVMNWAWAYQNHMLEKTVDGITFPNPVGLGAGFDYNGDLVETLPAMGFGFHTIGTVTLHSYEGNPPPRLVRFPKSQAILVNKGLKNIGAAAIIKKLATQHFEIPVGISIASTNRLFKNEAEQIVEIVECFKLFEQSSVPLSYYELNISCPNTFGGEPFTTVKKLQTLLRAIDKLKLKKPLYTKMPIDLSEAETIALLEVLDQHSVQGVIFGNLTKDKTNPAVHPDDLKQWHQLKGNVSGKPTWERSNHWVELTRQRFGNRFTIIGTGGIFTGQDAWRKLQLGADLVQVVTGMIYEGPTVIGQINQFLAQKLSSVAKK